MSKIILDAQLRAKLNGLNEQLDVYDENGTKLGCFLPEAVYMELLYAWAREQFADEEELKQAREEVKTQGGYTTAEAIAYLEKVAGDAKGGS
jgi:hypothetical protein